MGQEPGHLLAPARSCWQCLEQGSGHAKQLAPPLRHPGHGTEHKWVGCWLCLLCPFITLSILRCCPLCPTLHF